MPLVTSKRDVVFGEDSNVEQAKFKNIDEEIAHNVNSPLKLLDV